jgi:hypothetical protein
MTTLVLLTILFFFIAMFVYRPTNTSSQSVNNSQATNLPLYDSHESSETDVFSYWDYYESFNSKNNQVHSKCLQQNTAIFSPVTIRTNDPSNQSYTDFASISPNYEENESPDRIQLNALTTINQANASFRFSPEIELRKERVLELRDYIESNIDKLTTVQFHQYEVAKKDFALLLEAYMKTATSKKVEADEIFLGAVDILIASMIRKCHAIDEFSLRELQRQAEVIRERG